MHRAVCRVIRGTCRKWRENECPAVGGEEIRKGGHKTNEEFVPPSKYNLTDAVGWSTGLVLVYEFTHRRKRGTVLIEECPPASVLERLTTGNTSTCPFGWPTKVVTQPILSRSVINVNSVKSRSTNLRKKTSIDLTPFIKEESSLDLEFNSNTSRIAAEEDESVIFSNEVENVNPKHCFKYSTPLATKHAEINPASNRLTLAEKLSGDLLSVLGAFKLLNSENGSKRSPSPDLSLAINYKATSKEPPFTAMELLEKGAELGSSRALYNIGVAYDRMNDEHLAWEYYRKASDLGHPLGTFNNAIFLLKDGRIAEGLLMMQVAAEKGVPEAQKIISGKCT